MSLGLSPKQLGGQMTEGLESLGTNKLGGLEVSEVKDNTCDVRNLCLSLQLSRLRAEQKKGVTKETRVGPCQLNTGVWGFPI